MATKSYRSKAAPQNCWSQHDLLYCLRQDGLPLRVAGRTSSFTARTHSFAVRTGTPFGKPGGPFGKPGDDATSATRAAGATRVADRFFSQLGQVSRF
ncbi:MAG: hypothetical protein FWD31_05525 [Planctomycetaceae bacterium]|nr:hypothetical protein [Planctomycetaceae bacterium]